jgi:hypothetical protein
MIRDYFITPHAVRKFQERVAQLPYDEVIMVVARALSVAPIEKHGATQNGRGMSIRVTDPFDFRAVILPGRDASEKPAVVTVLKSGRHGRNRGKLARYLEIQNRHL